MVKASKLTGVGASEGVAEGPVFAYVSEEVEPEHKTIREEAVKQELRRFRQAIDNVVRNLTERAERLSTSGRNGDAAIFEFHSGLVEDPELASKVEERIRKLESPENAVLAVGEEYAAEFAMMDDDYLAARADDVRNVADHIVAVLTGRWQEGLEAIETPSVIVARNLFPSHIARIPSGMALGFVTAEGSRTSHVAIMARSMGIPAVVGVGPAALEAALDAHTIAVDGGVGIAILDPDKVAKLEAKSDSMASQREAGKWRVLVVHSFNDKGHESRLQQIRFNSSLDDIDFRHFCIIDAEQIYGVNHLAIFVRSRKDREPSVEEWSKPIYIDSLKANVEREVGPRLDQEIIEFNPDVVIVHGGTIFDAVPMACITMLEEVLNRHPDLPFALQGKREWLDRQLRNGAFSSGSQRWVLPWVRDNFVDNDEVQTIMDNIF